MARPKVKPINKRKRGRPAKATGANKRAKKSWGLDFYLVFGPVSSKAKDSFSVIWSRSLLKGFSSQAAQPSQEVFFTNSSTYPSGLGAGTSFDFLPRFSYWVWDVFHRSIFEFPPRFPFQDSEVFSHQISKDRFFLLEVFSTTFHHNSNQSPYARRSLHPSVEEIVMTWSRDQATWPVPALLHLPRYHHQVFQLRPYPVTFVLTFRSCATYLSSTFRPCKARHPLRFTIRPARDGTHLWRARTFRSQLSPLAISLNVISRKDTIAQYHPARRYRLMSPF